MDLCSVKTQFDVAAAGVAGVDAHGLSLVVVVLVQGPRVAAGHDDGPGPVVVVQRRLVVVRELLVTNEVVVEVEVEGVVAKIVGANT